MKAIMMNETDGSYQHMTGFDRIQENHTLGGKANVAHRAYWNSILSHFGMSIDDVGAGPGGLVVTGGSEAIKKFQNIVEGGTNGVFTAFVSSSGQVSIARLPHMDIEYSRLNSKQKAFISILEEATDVTKKTVTIGIVEDDEEVIVGSHGLEKIDVNDMLAFGRWGTTLSASSMLGHEIGEQVEKQRSPVKAYHLNHDKAVRRHEDLISGNFRVDVLQVAPTSKYIEEKTTDGKGKTLTGYIDLRYIVGTETITLRMYMEKGNIYKVDQKVKNP